MSDDRLPWFSDAEVDAMCEGLVQDAARIRHLRAMGLRVDRRPNGRPLAWRPGEGPPVQQPMAGQQPEVAQNAAQAASGSDVVQSLQQWAATRRSRRGATAQGR